MASRVLLQEKLEQLLGSSNVYYQPPESVKMEYPAIRYSREFVFTEHASDNTHRAMNRYEVTVIDRKPDNPVIEKLLALPYCSYERTYKSDNLNHDVLILYF